MFIDLASILLQRQDGDACLRMELTQDFVDHARNMEMANTVSIHSEGDVPPITLLLDISGPF
jgi:hypothetical protein